MSGGHYFAIGYKIMRFRFVSPSRSLRILAFLVGFCHVLFPVNTASAKTVNVADCSLDSVQDAVDAAAAGDIVVVPSGSCTWNSSLSISKSITLRGAGTENGGTWINYGGNGHTLVYVDGPSSRGRVDISGFRFIGGDSNHWNGNAMQIYGPKGWKGLRVHHNVFEDNYPWTIVAETGTNGLIDNNIFTGRAHGIKTYGDGASDWSTPLVLGTSDFMFIESNMFDYDDFYGATGSPAVDMFGGGRVVFRHNTLRQSYFGTHDKARSGLVSANAYEIYENSFWTDSNKWKGLDITAGTGVLWNNSFQGDWTIAIGAMDYKSFDPRSVRRCDGSDPADQNVPGENGWRCQYQIGTQGEGATAFSYPLYLWSNTINASAARMECTDGCSHLQAGRDYIDNGNSAKPGYTAFRFPHPLADGARQPRAPSDLRVN